MTHTPIAGYRELSPETIALINEFKQDEERLLRKIERVTSTMQPTSRNDEHAYDVRWAFIARTHFQEGFMALNRSLAQPGRIALPEDLPESASDHLVED